jgi:hypothetical protein
LPGLDGVRADCAWHGVLGVPRDWRPRVAFDRARGIAWAGGYVGEGVAAANLAGRTLRDLLLGHDTELTRLPWVGGRSRDWEPEPLRYAGARSVYALLGAADRSERRRGRPSAAARAAVPRAGLRPRRPGRPAAARAPPARGRARRASRRLPRS